MPHLVLSFVVGILVSFFIMLRLISKLKSSLRTETRDAHSNFVRKDDDIIREAAVSLGCDVTNLPNGFQHITRDGKTAYSRGSYFDFESLVAAAICSDYDEVNSVINEINTTPALYIVDVPGRTAGPRIGERLVNRMLGLA